MPKELLEELPEAHVSEVTSSVSSAPEPYDAIMDRLDELTKQVSLICKGSNVKCWYCQKPGHCVDRCDAMLKKFQEGGCTGKTLPKLV